MLFKYEFRSVIGNILDIKIGLVSTLLICDELYNN